MGEKLWKTIYNTLNIIRKAFKNWNYLLRKKNKKLLVILKELFTLLKTFKNWNYTEKFKFNFKNLKTKKYSKKLNSKKTQK
jgi:hypothetical protein